jgi:hypothetical protein
VISVLNAPAPTADKTDDMQDSFYEKLEHVFTKYHTKTLLGDFNAKVGREDIFKPTIGNKSLQEISNNNGAVNSATSKSLTCKSTIFPQCNIHKFTWTPRDGKTQNQTNHILKDRRQHSRVSDV